MDNTHNRFLMFELITELTQSQQFFTGSKGATDTPTLKKQWFTKGGQENYNGQDLAKFFDMFESDMLLGSNQWHALAAKYISYTMENVLSRREGEALKIEFDKLPATKNADR